MVELHNTWNIIDSSKIDTFKTCPRKFFYEYVLGWRSETPNHDLIFGEAWHRAREHQLLNGYNDIQGAYEKFINYYREYFSPETDELYLPKVPATVLLALQKFAEERFMDLEDNELLYTEISGSVPIAEDKVIYYRMDSVLRSKITGKIFSWDHKSAKKFNKQWSEKFHLSTQNGTYTHCMYCMYPIEEVAGLEFCGTAFQHLKRASQGRPAGYHVDFLRVPAFKTPDQMSTWIWNVNVVYDMIMDEFEYLSDCKEGDQVLESFPMNTTSCMNYFGCQYHDFCLSWQNPLQYANEPPLGFKQEFWDPTAIKTTNKINHNFKPIKES